MGPPDPPEPARAEDAVRLTYTLSKDDVRAAGIASSQHSIMANALGAAFAVSGLFSLVANGDAVGFVTLALGGLVLSGQAIGFLTVIMVGRRPDLLREPVELTVTSESIRTVMPSMSGEARWSSYKRVRSTRSTMLLELGTGPAVLIPNRVFTSDNRARVIGWAAAAGILDTTPAAKAMVIGILAGIAFNAVIFAAVVLAFNL